jgi:predicted acetyltransferase
LTAAYDSAAMSEIEVVDVAGGGTADFVATSLRFWGEVPDPGIDTVHEVLDRALIARVDGQDAGTAAVIDFQLTLPGGGRVAMDGVTWVAVSPVARRRGALRAMMNHMLDSARERGVPVLGLGASESAIYRRFGYGVASHIGQADIDTAHAALRVPFHDPGRLRLIPLDEAMAVWLDVESKQPHRVGGINRSEATWRRITVNAAKAEGAMSMLHVVVHEDATGVVDGFVSYRQELRWPDEIADGIVHVRELTALNRDAHVALWQHVLELDLIEHLSMVRYWLDDPIQHLLADWRRLRVKARDDLHLRVVDVVALLQARRYSREGVLVIEVRDDSCPDIAGRYRLEGGLDGAAAQRTDAEPDIVLDAPTLGSLLLGDVSAMSLYSAGLIEAADPRAARHAGAMFSWAPRPWLNYMF